MPVIGKDLLVRGMDLTRVTLPIASTTRSPSGHFGGERRRRKLDAQLA